MQKKDEKRFSLPVNVEADVKKYYGSTYNWKETGYILQDGTRLDLSGKNEGARGGYRTVDHRDIFTIYEKEDYSYGTEGLNEFIARGNIRVMPESPGITLQVEPNAEQYRLIQDFVERVGFKEGYFSVDIDNKYGDTIETLAYEGRPSGRKVVADLKYYFKEGKLPYKSELSSFRYSFDLIDNYTEKQYNDFGWVRVNDVLTPRENADFRSKYAKIKSGQIRANRTKNGEIIVAVNDGKDKAFGVDNVLVFAKGTIDNYKINKVVKINLYDETSIEIVRSEIYEQERIGNDEAITVIKGVYGEDLISEFTQQAVLNSWSYKDLKRRQRSREESGRIDEANQREQDGRGTSQKTQGAVRYSLDTEKVAGIRRVTEEQDKLTLKERIENVKEKSAEGWLATQIEFTNVQADSDCNVVGESFTGILSKKSWEIGEKFFKKVLKLSVGYGKL